MIRARAAYTLVEVVVVLVILAIIGAATVPALRGPSSASALDDAHRRVVDWLETARGAALGSGHRVAFAIDPATRRAWRNDTPLPTNIEMPAGCELHADAARVVGWFAADGSAALDPIRVQCAQAERAITLDALDGHARGVAP